MKLKALCSELKQSIENNSKVILAMEAFVTTWAILRIGNLHAMNILAFFLFLVILIFFSAVERALSDIGGTTIKKQKVLSGFLAIIFTAFYLSDTQYTIVSDLNNQFFRLVILAVTAIGLYFFLYKGIWYLMYQLKQVTLADNKKGEKIIPYLPLLSFVFLVLCRIPWLLYSYPGIMTPDSINQFEQVLGMKPYSNHHPWLHTMTISLFYHIGTLFTSNVNEAFVFYTLFQICFMAFAVSYFIRIISKYIRSLPLLCGLIALYAFLPYHNIMAICIWKDVLFSGTVFLFCTSLFHLVKEGMKTKNILSVIIYFSSGFFMCLYRSNGWYAFMITIPFLLFVFRKQWKFMYPLHFFLLSLVLFVKGPVMEHYEVEQPDFVESLSIPLQQIGRLIATGSELELTPEHNILIDKVIDRTHIPQLYTEYISDNMKELVRANNPEYLFSHKNEYLKLWIELGLKYPEVYYDAYVAQTHGYYSPSITYSVADMDGIIDNDTGLYREYLIHGKVLLKSREILNKLQNIVPLYGALWSMGSLFWGTLLFLVLTLGQSYFSNSNTEISHLDFITIWMPNIAIIGTLLIATPVAAEFRYAYNLAYCLPLYFSIMLVSKNK